MRYLNSVNKEIEIAEKKMNSLHKERSDLFFGDEKLYFEKNKEFQSSKKYLQGLYRERSLIKAFFHEKVFVPKSQIDTGRTYLRFETLPKSIEKHIYREWINGKWIYGIKNTNYIGRTLKDIVGFIRDNYFFSEGTEKIVKFSVSPRYIFCKEGKMIEFSFLPQQKTVNALMSVHGKLMELLE